MIKKAISPLIATILLIVVAVALIAIVLTWGKSFTTNNLADTDVVDSSCVGAAIDIYDCSVNSDNNAILYVRNIGSTYSFATSDIFKIDVLSDTGTYASGLNITDYDLASTWAGLAPGETQQINLDLNGNSVTGNFFDITVRSSVCSAEAVSTYKNCHS
jgi:flagellin-like protein